MKNITLLLLFTVLLACCSSDSETPMENTNPEAMYFPPNGSGTWDTKSPTALNWNEGKLQELYDYLEEKNTKGFIILVNGRIAAEKYFDSHTATSPWYWASAGKTLTATVTGIAQAEGHLNINNKVSDYLSTGWTSAPLAKENLITVRHLLTMTSGLDDTTGDDVSPSNLLYKADAGTRWGYHNVFVKLQDVVAEATGKTWTEYFISSLKNKIGMTGTWNTNSPDLSVYWSNTRSMARFGLLMLNEGKWDGQQVVDTAYWSAMTSTSQDINKGYGYLWWINGEESFHLPQSQLQFNGSLILSGPSDMYMALGKNDQKIYVIPGRNMVIVRMGEAADGENFALSDFDATLWQKINVVIEN
ncbi:MAG: class C beta-lactamase-related serine hydrolase [Flavobacterium sp.]|nr:MAG: class C beta-lactamase-related serine hydrolase [Flavobacterium sp.]